MFEEQGFIKACLNLNKEKTNRIRMSFFHWKLTEISCFLMHNSCCLLSIFLYNVSFDKKNKDIRKG